MTEEKGGAKVNNMPIRVDSDIELEKQRVQKEAEQAFDIRHMSIKSHKPTYQEFKQIHPYAHNLSRKQLRQEYRNYLKFANKKDQ